MKGYKKTHSKIIPSKKKVSNISLEKPLSEPKKQEEKIPIQKQKILSNHERIIEKRAQKLGITIELYKTQYPKGFSDEDY